MTTTATETTELEEDIAIIVDMVRPFHEFRRSGLRA